MPALRPLQPVLGAAPERLKHAAAGASMERRVHGWRATKDTEATRSLTLPRRTAPNGKVQGRGATMNQKYAGCPAPRPLQPVLGTGAGDEARSTGANL
jgi:hypothetical protein